MLEGYSKLPKGWPWSPVRTQTSSTTWSTHPFPTLPNLLQGFSIYCTHLQGLKRGSWQEIQYKGDRMRRPLSSSEVPWLVRLLLYLSDAFNAYLELDPNSEATSASVSFATSILYILLVDEYEQFPRAQQLDLTLCKFTNILLSYIKFCLGTFTPSKMTRNPRVLLTTHNSYWWVVWSFLICRAWDRGCGKGTGGWICVPLERSSFFCGCQSATYYCGSALPCWRQSLEQYFRRKDCCTIYWLDGCFIFILQWILLHSLPNRLFTLERCYVIAIHQLTV